MPSLLILLLILPFSICDDCPSSSDDSAIESCISNLLPNKYCCYDLSTNKCFPIEKGKLKAQSSSNIICQFSDENLGKYEFEQYHPKQDFDIGFETCGKYQPSKKEDCTDYSEISNSCCYFKHPNGKKACFHIGRKYIGDFKEKTTEINGVSVTYECKSFNILFNLYSVLLIILLL